MSVLCRQPAPTWALSRPGRWVGIYNLDSIMRLNGLRMADADAVLHRLLPMVERRLPFWVCVLLGLCIAWTLARLTWDSLPHPRNTTPIYTAQSASAPVFDAAKLAGMHLFGTANTSGPINAPETTLNLILRGIVAADKRSAESRAIIASSGSEHTYAVGAELPGGAQIQAIYADHVLLNLNGRMQSLRLPKAGGGANTGNNLISPVSMPSVVYGTSLPPAQNLNQLRNELVSHPERLLDVMRALPVLENGKLAGYRVFPVGNSNAFAQLGLRPGDVVTAVNGMPLNNPAESMRILNSIRASDQVSITLTRNGQQQTQILQMQNPK